MTTAETEGPYFKAGSPKKENLRNGSVGRPLTLTGLVRSPSCTPIAKAKLDFWQANGNGSYDNSGYRLRGHVFTDAQGRYRIDTVVPGLYPGRTRHIHVKVAAPGRPPVTTQLYVPGEAQNKADGIYDAANEMQIVRKGAKWKARFNFAVKG